VTDERPRFESRIVMHIACVILAYISHRVKHFLDLPPEIDSGIREQREVVTGSKARIAYESRVLDSRI
jgi:hypothetical protein